MGKRLQNDRPINFKYYRLVRTSELGDVVYSFLKIPEALVVERMGPVMDTSGFLFRLYDIITTMILFLSTIIEYNITSICFNAE